jgi:hypothetical protein
MMGQQPTLDGHVTGYTQGNAERWSYIVSTYLPRAWSLIVKTIDPLAYAALIELLGSSQHFRKQSADITPVLDETHCIVGLGVRLVYSVPDFKGFTGAPQAITQDQQYILSKVQQVPGIKWSQNSVAVDVKQGLVTVNFQLAVGA